jgi:inhibitor of KinA sporulation pathway (predicted exonuclease)
MPLKNAIGSNRIIVTGIDLAKVEPPNLNATVREIISDSKVESLQAFVKPDNRVAIIDSIRAYWGISS